jgi:RHS repeat-associated protein
MEKENEIYGEGNAYDFGARLYDSRIGRWFRKDKMKSIYPSESHYAFAGNSPLYYKDFGGYLKIKYDKDVLYKNSECGLFCAFGEERIEQINKTLYDVISDPKNSYILDVISNATGLSKDDILHDLTPGQGPEVQFGEKTHANNSTIKLSYKTYAQLSKLTGEDLYKQSLAVMIILLHEYTHLGDQYCNGIKEGGTGQDPKFFGPPSGMQQDKTAKVQQHRGKEIEAVFGVSLSQQNNGLFWLTKNQIKGITKYELPVKLDDNRNENSEDNKPTESSDDGEDIWILNPRF